MGHTLLYAKQYDVAYFYFKKLRDVSKMGNDLETTMYAFKQIGYCQIRYKDYIKAEKAIKL